MVVNSLGTFLKCDIQGSSAINLLTQIYCSFHIEPSLSCHQLDLLHSHIEHTSLMQMPMFSWCRIFLLQVLLHLFQQYPLEILLVAWHEVSFSGYLQYPPVTCHQHPSNTS